MWQAKQAARRSMAGAGAAARECPGKNYNIVIKLYKNYNIVQNLYKVDSLITMLQCDNMCTISNKYI